MRGIFNQCTHISNICVQKVCNVLSRLCVDMAETLFARSCFKMVIDTHSCPFLSHVSGNTAGTIAEHQQSDPWVLCDKGRAI